jgi:hypothetical protein
MASKHLNDIPSPLSEDTTGPFAANHNPTLLPRSLNNSRDQSPPPIDASPFTANHNPSLLPRFLNYRELFTYLYSNKGVDLEPVKSLIQTQNIDALVELIAFILDRPISPDEQMHLYAPSGPYFGHSPSNPVKVDNINNNNNNNDANKTVVKFGAANYNVPLTDLHQNALLPGHRFQERDVVDYLGLAQGCRQQTANTWVLLTLLPGGVGVCEHQGGQPE